MNGNHVRSGMNGTTIQLLVLTASTGAGMLMVLAGVHKNTLEWKRRKRVCPSCGREIVGRTCTHHP